MHTTIQLYIDFTFYCKKKKKFFSFYFTFSVLLYCDLFIIFWQYWFEKKNLFFKREFSFYFTISNAMQLFEWFLFLFIPLYTGTESFSNISFTTSDTVVGLLMIVLGWNAFYPLTVCVSERICTYRKKIFYIKILQMDWRNEEWKKKCEKNVVFFRVFSAIPTTNKYIYIQIRFEFLLKHSINLLKYKMKLIFFSFFFFNQFQCDLQFEFIQIKIYKKKINVEPIHRKIYPSNTPLALK